MHNKYKLSLLERYGWVESLLRRSLENHPRIKKTIKMHRIKNTQGDSKQDLPEINPQLWDIYKDSIKKLINYGDIILIHSSTDGLANIGVNPDQCMEFLKSLVVERNCTIVMACFPVTNLKPPTEKSKPYDPKRTFCWTGMLANAFLADPKCIRTRFPFNSLAAMGPKAEEMMAKDLDAIMVYDNNSAWRYCCDHHAKILFVGVKASSSNTMAIHMLPDYMGDEWPIDGWYEESIYKVKVDNQIIEVPVKKQKGNWYKYVMEEGTSGRLKRAGLLQESSIGGCNLGIVHDGMKMLEFLADEARKGRLTYLIPRRYYKEKV